MSTEKSFKEQFEERVKRDEEQLAIILHSRVFDGFLGADERLVAELLRHLQACIRAYDSCTKFDADGIPFHKAQAFLESLKTK